MITTAWQARIDLPRDRNGSFEPRILPKRTRRLGGTTDMILSLYARGMTTRDINAHLAEVYGIDVSHETIAKVTEVVMEENRSWQCRPVDEVYPIVFVDGIGIQVRDDGAVTNNKIVHLVVDVEEFQHVLGIRMAAAEASKFWPGLFTELRNRGLKDVLSLCCDGLTGLPDSAATIWPDVTVQTCVVHLIHASMKYVAYDKCKALTAAMKAIYAAPSVTAAEAAFEDFTDAWGQRYPGEVAIWRRAWNEFIPFPDFPVKIRRIIYMTNQIESINHRLRKVTKNRGHFPNDDDAIKLLYLALRNMCPERGGDLGTGTYGWKKALDAFAIALLGRLPSHDATTPYTEHLTEPGHPPRGSGRTSSHPRAPDHLGGPARSGGSPPRLPGPCEQAGSTPNAPTPDAPSTPEHPPAQRSAPARTAA